MTHSSNEIVASCHCGAVSIRLAAAPVEVTECNCSLCRRYGVLWVYCDAHQVEFPPDQTLTDSYAWNGRHVDFHRCRRCGCLTHWLPRDPTRARRGINGRMLPPALLGAARVRHLDGADTGKYLD